MRDLQTRGNCAIYRGWGAKITTGILVQPSMEASTQQTKQFKNAFSKRNLAHFISPEICKLKLPWERNCVF